MLIYIHSRDYSFATDFRAKLPGLITTKRFKVRQVYIPNTIYNITSANYKIYITVGVTTTSVTLVPGNYSIDDLVSHIQTKLNAAALATFTVTYSRITAKVTIAADATFSLLLGTYTDNPASIIGFEQVNYTGDTTYTGPNVFNISSQFLQLKSAILTNGAMSSNFYGNDPSSNITMSIPISSLFGGLMYLDDSLSQWVTYPTNKQITSFDLKLTDEYNSAISLNGRNFTVIIEFDETK